MPPGMRDTLHFKYEGGIKMNGQIVLCKSFNDGDFQKIVDFLTDYCHENSIIFVHGHGKRKSIHILGSEIGTAILKQLWMQRLRI